MKEKSNADPLTDATKLRRRAEQQLKNVSKKIIPGADKARDLHELQVHQIELEMQNEELRRAHQDVEAVKTHYANLYEFSPVGYLTLERNGAIREANLTASQLMGMLRQMLMGRRLESFVTAEYKPSIDVFLEKVFASNSKEVIEVMFLSADTYHLFVHIEAIANAGENTCLAVMVDTTERREREDALQLAATMFNTMDNAVIVTDRHNRIVSVNPAFTEITGYSPDEVIGKDPKILSSGRHPPEFYREMWNTLNTTGSWQGEVTDRHKNGDLYIKWLTLKQVHDKNGQLTHHMAISSDLSKRTATEEHLHHLAYHDPLTGLPNRMLLSDRLRQALNIAKRDQTHLALLYFDLDKFKPVNDDFGHNIGDLLLQEMTARLQGCLRESDTAARMGGDEFVVLLPNIEGEQGALMVAEKIRSALAVPYELAGHGLDVTSSIGIATYPQHGADENILLKNADAAMYGAKQSGGNNVSMYSAESS